jgi:protein ImuB
MLWLALQFPRLGLEVWAGEQDTWALSAKKELQAQEPPAQPPPTVLLEDNRVVLGNGRADEIGILPGCTLATAHSISADLVHFHRDEAREQARLEFLAEILYRFSGQVSLAEPDGIVLEIGASLALFGDPDCLARQAATLCQELGHAVRWQLASTPLAALVMARANVRCLEEVTLGCAEIPAASKNVERLANMGMHTLLPLLQLPRTEIGRRFGPELVDYLDRLTGRAPDPKQFIEPSPQFNQALNLLEPVRAKDALLFPMQRLLEELSCWLTSRQLGAEQLIWSFSDHTEDARVVLPLRFARPQQHRDAFMSIVRLRLEQVELPGDVLNVRLEAARLSPWAGGSRSLFTLAASTPETMSDAESSALLDQLNARLGERACTGIAARNQHAPESAWAPIRHRGGRNRGATLPDLPRPLQTIWRDYYVACLENGAKCWAFVDARNQWYLHGYFG